MGGIANDDGIVYRWRAPLRTFDGILIMAHGPSGVSVRIAAKALRSAHVEDGILGSVGEEGAKSRPEISALGKCEL